MPSSRDNVQPLIKGVPEARFQGFSTHAAAAQHYAEAKRARKVRIVRNPGDGRVFGPMHGAVQ
jgi:hypothetical protein